MVFPLMLQFAKASEIPFIKGKVSTFSMKEQLYTIPLNDAVNAGDECPFCFIERSVEQDLLDFVLGGGASYMEADIREQTDKAGFCRPHFQKMFQYGNTLGNAWILKTHYKRMLQEMHKEFNGFKPGKTSLKDRLTGNGSSNAIASWVHAKESSCYICKQFNDTFERYMDTFFYLWKEDPEFKDKIRKSKGFCLSHFGALCEASDSKLSDRDKEEFYNILFSLMENNFERLSEDVSWLVEKFDYRNKDADWKNSKDAIQRSMQKLKGGYPADAPYRPGK